MPGIIYRRHIYTGYLGVFSMKKAASIDAGLSNRVRNVQLF